MSNVANLKWLQRSLYEAQFYESALDLSFAKLELKPISAISSSFQFANELR